MIAKGEAAGLDSAARFTASQLAIVDLPRMVRLDVPWWNRRAALAVDRFLAEREQPAVFEFGSGSSTVWLARRAASVVSVEPHAEWANALSAPLRPYPQAEVLVRSVHAGGGAFAAAIGERPDNYDLIVIDGRERAACLHAALPHLKPGGIVLFDDSGRRRYRRAIRASGLVERRYFGAAFAKPYPDFTSLLQAPVSG